MMYAWRASDRGTWFATDVVIARMSGARVAREERKASAQATQDSAWHTKGSAASAKRTPEAPESWVQTIEKHETHVRQSRPLESRMARTVCAVGVPMISSAATRPLPKACA